LTIFQLLTKGKRKIIDIKLLARNNNNSLSKMGCDLFTFFICKELFAHVCLNVDVEIVVLLLFGKIMLLVSYLSTGQCTIHVQYRMPGKK
jgi:hypothetical protein